MSSHIRARKHKANQLATLVTLAFPAAAMAQQAQPQVLPEVKVEAQAESYKVDKLSSPKQTQPILDIPQVVNVIKKDLIQEQGATSLMEALRNTPGITMQLGENGNTSAGDTFQLRGFSAQNSTFVDGVRDMGAVTRDVFNLEQVEVVKGPSGGDIGRGASAGYINLVTKQANLENATGGTVSWNTGDSKRTTVDLNRKVGDTSGFRLNAMVQGGGVDGRDVVENNSYAIAPAFATGLGTQTRVFLSGQFVRQNNNPDGGIPGIGLPGFNRTAVTTGSASGRVTDGQATAITNSPMVNRENFYGNVNDYEKVKANMLTAKIEHDLSETTTIRNTTRWGRTVMDRLMTSPNALVGFNVDGGGPVGAITPYSQWTVNLSRQRIYQENEILANQTNINTELYTGSFKHSISTGLEFMREKQFTPSYESTTVTDLQSLYSPNNYLDLPVNALDAPYTNGKTATAAAYLFDTMELSKHWLLNAGVRMENYRTETDSITRVSTGNQVGFPGHAVGDLVPAKLTKTGNLVSWKVGAVYKPVSNGSIYAAMANSVLPPGGGSFNLSAATNSINGPGFKEQETRSVEVGTKWDLLNKRLNLSAAVYRMTAKNELVQDTSNPTVFGSTGERVVEGVELGAVGQITNNWLISAGVAHMNTEIKKGTEDNNAQGAVTRWSPDLTATLWTTYNLDKWSIGGGARYVSEQKRVVNPEDLQDLSQVNGIPSIPSYTVFDAMVSYKLDKNVTLRLNVYNLTDKFYIDTLNNGGTRVRLGAPRTAMLTAQFQF